MSVREFTVTEEHLVLLSRMYVGWSRMRAHFERYAVGAPAIDAKRPYGNTEIEKDMVRILGIPTIDPEADEVEKRIGTPAYERLLQLHHDTETALQIVLHTRSFEPGKYVIESWFDDTWKKVPE